MKKKLFRSVNLIKFTIAGAALLASGQLYAQDAPPPASLQELLAGENAIVKAGFLARYPLLKDVFAKTPPAELKGLASKIRAGEVDQKNRIKAVQYLATVDCIDHPEVPKVLVKTMHTDKWEPVRYEAAVALKTMMTAGKRPADESPDRFRGWFTKWRRSTPTVRRGDEKRRTDYCRGCCSTETLKQLAKTAYDMNEDGGCFEPSKRVREMAASAIQMCGIPCDQCGGADVEETGPVAIPVPKPAIPSPLGPGAIPLEKEKEPTDSGEPVDIGEPNDVTATNVSFRTVSRRLAVQAPEKKSIQALNGMCIVTMAQGRPQKASPVFESVYKGRVYQFSGPEAKMTFDRAPESYSVAFGGFDPVQFVDSHQLVEGRYLLRHDNRMYNFATQANWKRFQHSPDRYILNDSGSSKPAVTPVSHQY